MKDKARRIYLLALIGLQENGGGFAIEPAPSIVSEYSVYLELVTFLTVATISSGVS
jgi:hypothetical protein